MACSGWKIFFNPVPLKTETNILPCTNTCQGAWASTLHQELAVIVSQILLGEPNTSQVFGLVRFHSYRGSGVAGAKGGRSATQLSGGRFQDLAPTAQDFQ